MPEKLVFGQTEGGAADSWTQFDQNHTDIYSSYSPEAGRHTEKITSQK